MVFAERRAIGTHSLNEHSSRSHMVIRLYIEGTLPYGVGKAKFTSATTPATSAGSGAMGAMKVTSVLNLVDLAVSGRRRCDSRVRGEFDLFAGIAVAVCLRRCCDCAVCYVIFSCDVPMCVWLRLVEGWGLVVRA